eukprot:5670301-Alexandrium_andersonii.AAC.1
MRKKRCRTHPSGASGINFEVVPGSAQFQFRTPEAMLHVTHGGLRIGAGCSTDGRRVDSGLHLGHPAN